MGSTNIAAPEKRDYYKETSDTLRAQTRLAPELYRAEEQFRGKYAQLDVDIAKKISPQLMDIYESVQPRLAAMDRQTVSAQREADIGAIEELGPRAMAAMRAADPAKASLMDELNQQALSDLKLGGQLNAGEQRQLSQSARGAQAARGFGYGINDAAIESWAQLQGGTQRKRERQGFAQSMVGMNQQVQGDPFMQILGRPSNVSPAMAGGVLGQAQGFNPGQMFSPESQYAGDIYNQQWQGELAARTANAANQAAISGAMIGAVGSIGGGMAKCWVAREVFGSENPQWLAFFDWKETKAPKWFKKLYNSFGERFAKFISNKPKLKKLIKTWMEDKING